MWLGEAADRRRIGDPPGAPRERGCPAWVVLGVKAVEARGVRAVPPGPFHHQRSGQGHLHRSA
jgi:hypothetical protein